MSGPKIKTSWLGTVRLAHVELGRKWVGPLVCHVPRSLLDCTDPTSKYSFYLTTINKYILYTLCCDCAILCWGVPTLIRKHRGNRTLQHASIGKWPRRMSPASFPSDMFNDRNAYLQFSLYRSPTNRESATTKGCTHCNPEACYAGHWSCTARPTSASKTAWER